MIVLHLISLFAFSTAVHGWTVHILPNGERLNNRVVGENLMVVCSVKGYEGPATNVSVYWMKDNIIIRTGSRISGIVKPLASKLMIVNSRKEDSGDYMCQVIVDGVEKVETATISFIKMPKFVDPKTDQHPEDGSTAEIECKVDGEPDVEVFWLFENKTIGESTTRPYDFKENKQVLVIPNFDSKKDDGLYTCTAMQSSTFERLPIEVTAYSRPSITIFTFPEDHTGYEGKAAVFKCAATGKPEPSYKWFKVAEDEEIVDSDLYQVNGGELKVNALAASNAGEYRCEASNAIGKDDKVAELKVFLRPAVEKIPNEVKENGEEVTFSCAFHGDGKVHAKFVFGEAEYKLGGSSAEADEDEEDEERTNDDEKNDDDDEDEETTTIDGDGEEEEEEEAAHDNSEVSDEVLAKEMHDAEHEEKEEKEEEGEDEEKEDKDEKGEPHEGHDISIAHVDAILVPATEMEDEEEVITSTEASAETNDDEDEEKDEKNAVEKKDEEDEDNDEDETTTGDAIDEAEDEHKKWKRFVRDVTNERVIVKEEGGVLTLTIRRLTQSDAGAYQCIVENEAGRTVRNASLAITHAPEITESVSDPIRTVDGADFSLRCAASAVPKPEWSWRRNGEEVESDGVRTIIETDEDADFSTLTVKDATKDDFGTIECVAKNGVGEPASAPMDVLRIVVPAVPSILNCTEHAYPNYGQCKIDAAHFETSEGEGTPTKIVFFVAVMSEAADADFDFRTMARNFTVDFNAAKMRLHNLDTNKAYQVRAMAVNEAGESDLSPMTPMETTDAWAPEAPANLKVACASSCELTWEAPNDHGADIIKYIVELREKAMDENNEFTVSTEKVAEFEVDASDESVVLSAIKPNTAYEVSIAAANEIGLSESAKETFTAPETLSSNLLESFASPSMLLVAGIVLALIFVVIDVLCFFTNRCGVLACCLRRCNADGHGKKTAAGTDLESGKTAESGRLLDGPAR